MPRRGCVALVVVLFALAWSSLARAAQPLKDPGEKFCSGDRCTVCHGATNPRGKAPKSGENFDVVIVGGGLGGLSTLHYLKDRKVVLLEAQDEVGGQMKTDTWKGIKYAKGAAYVPDLYGVLKNFFESEKVPLVRMAEPDNSAWIDGKHYPNCWAEHGRDKMPWNEKDMKPWLQFLEEMSKINTLNESNQPFECFKPEVQELDTVNSREWMKKYGLTDEQIAHFDLYIPSCFGVTSDKLSASAIANFLSGETVPSMTMEGGLGGPIEVLAKNHKDRIRVKCRVTEITQDSREARVTYVGPDDKWHVVTAKAVVVAIPSRFVPSIIPGLPKEKRDAISKISYASYLVAAVLCNEVLWDDKGYDTWIKGTFFKDIIDATWILRKGKPYENKKQPHVLSLYIPLGEEGAQQMVDWTPEKFKETILTDLERVIPGSRKKIEDVRLYRFGHNMHVASPGFMKQIVPILRKPFYRIHFAGAEVEGLPCCESAVFSGHGAARAVQTWLWDAPLKGASK